ncbi:glycosyltransferase, WecB/TagA/CpsF family protein [Clostridium argentinense CDC 2741]|uniref:N-acetylglucosaminyldiphosphoundecaprenol N-acetyl-beta-D-mannosaminyltransferase n=1 Tax=Clostridium argentinense CDC 2741 TaxID=1418104 RepID=A0A0C1RAG8_9CLOT|nr:WecB/TagA/CpsF family glycosyltransferase [Clostridium argentinense]ARC84503.1 glycosyltransferase [Clostridium argentinense]KIE47421.1 glycosyltransferase, WecB/TagA/CpsF family protein [Clostridium argentinense CDC 2741]NFF38714.1 WecB/TagA/CpsF family glycosyltransferase [Clostridium argentinense]NFP48939.1 WecB/TagA/CpsF family glycosyltransferase [Clostridium argentinense]NFP72604.1 WecB/TagA/CpsF family glycosyltransferase [Clostridium argentinense]
MGIELLNYTIFSGSKKELIDYVVQKDKVNIISGNPEILNLGLTDEALFRSFNDNNSVIIPDGIGTVIASKLVKTPVKEKIAGIEVMEELISYCEVEEKPVYLLGTSQENLDGCINKLKIKYPRINIVGSHNGYFDMNSCDHIVEEIKNKSPYALFIAMGAPRQENFIIKYMEELPCSIFMGVGGSFDVISGKVNRAPKWMINLGLEWLYRTIKEPSRIKRLGEIPKFLHKVIKVSERE